MQTTTPCKTCGGKGYLIKAVRIGGGFARQDDRCAKCKGTGVKAARKTARKAVA